MIVIVLPAYNEEEAIGNLLQRIDNSMSELPDRYTIIVVDDGSTDNTAAVAKSHARKLPVQVVSHEANKGLAAALRTGLTRACEMTASDDIVVTMEGDNTNDPRHIATMLRKLGEEDLDVVVASPFARGGQFVVPFRRAVLSRGANMLLGMLFPLKGVTCRTGLYRIYRAPIIHDGFAYYGERFIESTGFTSVAEILLKLSRLTSKVGEIPITHIYPSNRKSSMKVSRTIADYLDLIRRCLPRRPLPD